MAILRAFPVYSTYYMEDSQAVSQLTFEQKFEKKEEGSETGDEGEVGGGDVEKRG